MRTVLALLAIVTMSAGCGARSEAGGPGVDAPGILVFSGVPSGSYLHAMRPDGTGLAEIELPKSCSPQSFSRDGRVLRCFEWSDTGNYAVERSGPGWRRVPLPPEWIFPQWVTDELDGSLVIDAPQWAPVGDRIALVRLSEEEHEHWFSFTGNVAVSNPEGTQERVVATDGEVPMWSPDGSRIAFARCRITGEIPHESAECSLWVVPADQSTAPEKLADKIDSLPVWSPDGRFVAFLRTTRPCTAACKSRIMAVPAEGVDARPVGPELVQPNELYWLPEPAAAIVPGEAPADDPLELQRCVDIWNRARMDWPKTAANVRLGEDGCQITAGGVEIAGVFATGFECWQPVPYSYRCASHGGALRVMDPQQRVWNAETDASAKLRLFDPPKAGRLPLPKAAPYPMFDGYIIPFDSKGQLRPGLTITETVEVEATCYDPGPDDYPGRCYLTYATCFRRSGGPADVVLCPEDAGSTRFHWVKLVEPREDPW